MAKHKVTMIGVWYNRKTGKTYAEIERYGRTAVKTMRECSAERASALARIVHRGALGSGVGRWLMRPFMGKVSVGWIAYATNRSHVAVLSYEVAALRGQDDY